MRSHSIRGFLVALVLLARAWATPALADETCNSPYMGKLIKGQEEYLQVWTLGVKGMGDELGQARHHRRRSVVQDLRKGRQYVSVGGRGEAHHMGFTDDRKYLWAGGLDDSKIFVFDVGTDPSKPKLVNTIMDLDEKTGFVGPHTFYALPGRMLVGALSNSRTRAGKPEWRSTTTMANSCGASDAGHQSGRRRLRL